MEIKVVSPEHLDLVWEEAAPLLEKALVNTDMALAFIQGQLRENLFQLWLGFDNDLMDTVMVTEIRQFEDYRVCYIWLLSGLFEKWQEHLTTIEEWAKLNNCIAMEIDGRKGWERTLKPAGYNFWSVRLRKPL